MRLSSSQDVSLIQRVRNDFAAATYNERRFQFRLVNHLFRVLPGFMGKSLVIAVRSSTEHYNKTRSGT